MSRCHLRLAIAGYCSVLCQYYASLRDCTLPSAWDIQSGRPSSAFFADRLRTVTPPSCAPGRDHIGEGNVRSVMSAATTITGA